MRAAARMIVYALGFVLDCLDILSDPEHITGVKEKLSMIVQCMLVL